MDICAENVPNRPVRDETALKPVKNIATKEPAKTMKEKRAAKRAKKAARGGMG
jgi:hypothetical protein